MLGVIWYAMNAHAGISQFVVQKKGRTTLLKL